ncbi:MAG: prephenate dehydrogenase [Vicinamibacterales bacterium]
MTVTPSAAPAPPARVLVVGAGLIGTSLGLAMRRAWPGVHVDAMDAAPAPAAAHRAAFHRLLDAATPIPACDLAVLACPVDAMPAWMDRLAALPGAVTVTDVGSVKRLTRDAARAAGLARYVGGHPMAGASVAGPTLASAGLFDGRPWFLEAGDAPADAVARVRELIVACGGQPVPTDPEAHDALVAAVSHLPQLVSSLLMSVVHDAAGRDGLACAAGGLRDTTRLAASAGSMWLPILAANRDHLAPLAAELARRLAAAAATLHDREAMGEVFAAANRHRREFESLL